MVMGRNVDDHLTNLKEVFTRLRNGQLQMNAKKCELFPKQVNFVGHVIFLERIAKDQFESGHNQMINMKSEV